jgi:hypothetical protein
LGAAGHALRALRIVLLGGALAVLWMVLTAVDSTAAPRQGDRSLAVLSDAPVVRDVVGGVLDNAREPEAADARPPEATGVVERPAEDRKTLPPKPVRSVATTVERAVSAPVPDAVPEVVTLVDATVQTAGELGSDVVEVAVSATDALPVAPVVAPVVDPVIDVVEAVVDEVTPPIAAVIPPAPPAGHPVPATPPTPSTGADGTTDEGRAVAAASPDASPHRAEAVPSAAAAAPGTAPAALVRPWLTALQEADARTDTAQHTARASDRSSLPTNPVPATPGPSGCVPGATSGGGGQLDQAANRVAALVYAPVLVPTCAAVHVSSVPGPSALPGFSPE